MDWLDVIIRPVAVEKIAEHSLTPADVEHVLAAPAALTASRSSGRPIAFGYVPDGRYVAVVFEWIDDVTILVITAFPVD